MRLTYLHPCPLPSIKPEVLQLLQMADAFAQYGLEVTLLSPLVRQTESIASLLGRSLDNKVRVVYIERGPRAYPARSNRLFFHNALRWLADQPTDVLYCRHLKAAEKALRAYPQIPLFFEYHEIFSQHFAQQPLAWWQHIKLRALQRRERLICKRASGLICLSQALADDLQQYYPCTHACVAGNGVELSWPQTPSLTPVQRPWNNPPVLLYLGSLHPWKGVTTLIEAMNLLNSAAQLWIAGGDERSRQPLKQQVQQRGLQDKVRFLGYVEPAQRFKLIAQTDICLLPLTHHVIASRYTSPLKLFEYMALAKPIISADVASIREIVQHRQQALLVEPEHPQALARAIEQLLNDRPLAQRLAVAAGEKIKQHSWLHRAEQLALFMQNCLAKK